MVTLLDVVAPLVEVGEGRAAPACVRGRRRRSWPRGLQREASPDPQSRQEHHRGERERESVWPHRRAPGLTAERETVLKKGGAQSRGGEVCFC
jgi:hypothetical protein